MISATFGYMTKQEAEMIGKLDKQNKPKRRPNGRHFSMPKTRVWRAKDVKQTKVPTKGA